MIMDERVWYSSGALPPVQGKFVLIILLVANGTAFPHHGHCRIHTRDLCNRSNFKLAICLLLKDVEDIKANISCRPKDNTEGVDCNDSVLNVYMGSTTQYTLQAVCNTDFQHNFMTNLRHSYTKFDQIRLSIKNLQNNLFLSLKDPLLTLTITLLKDILNAIKEVQPDFKSSSIVGRRQHGHLSSGTMLLEFSQQILIFEKYVEGVHTLLGRQCY